MMNFKEFTVREFRCIWDSGAGKGFILSR